MTSSLSLLYSAHEEENRRGEGVGVESGKHSSYFDIESWLCGIIFAGKECGKLAVTTMQSSLQPSTMVALPDEQAISS